MPTRATRTSTRREAPATGSDTQQTGPLRRSSKSTASSIVPRQAVIPAQTKPLDADLSPSGQGLEVTTGVDKGQSRTDGRRASPVFEMVVLGSGGGPLETDCSGYLLKPYASRWEDGILALEGGSGLGALSTLLSHQDEADMFPTLRFPPEYNTPILKAAYVFSWLTCYLITHAHLDHVHSLIMLSGSIPPRPRLAEHYQAPLITPVISSNAESQPAATPVAHPYSSSANDAAPPPNTLPRPPVYGTRETLQRLAEAYDGGLWPELGCWSKDAKAEDEDKEEVGRKAKRRKTGKRAEVPQNGKDGEEKGNGDEDGRGSDPPEAGVVFSPMKPCKIHRPLHPTLPISTLVYPVAHGCTSHGLYESSAVFVRYDPAAISPEAGEARGAGSSSLSSRSSGDAGNGTDTGNGNGNGNGDDSDDNSLNEEAEHRTADSAESRAKRAGFREFLFFGDVESEYRQPGEEGSMSETIQRAGEMNDEIWDEAARSWIAGSLAGVFIECSYDSSRPAHLMFGHVSPPGLYHEIKSLAAKVQAQSASSGADTTPPLAGLRVFITHIKESLVPHPSGKSARERIMAELVGLEEEGQLGVDFVEVKRGDRILI